ncbi:hypothetical protein [Actinomadura oligospora]|uniref:hypothetical protein n=1 Tax=Actinomadura oligospora TaxID=111804 RepID=UPI00047E9A92|nr:hypothetical protein [Actinomadura oligospora]
MAIWDADALAELRAAAFRGDGAAAFGMLRNRPVEPVLQFAGDLLTAALREGRTEAEPLARRCLDALDARDAPGDALLAATLRQALDARSADASQPDGDAQPVPVDLGALAYALADGDPITILDLRTGDLLAEDDLEPEPDATHSTPDPHDLIALYRDMASAHDDMLAFAETSANTPAPMQTVHTYTDALAGTHLEFAWELFREERQRGRARQWLADHNLRAVHRPFL